MTIKDIARLAGCGVSTVSRALNGSSEISDATRARINEVIQKYNYTPNGNARRMRQTAPNSVLLIVNGSSNLFFSPLIEQIQTAAESAGLQLVVNYIDEQEDEVQTAAQLCVEQKPARDYLPGRRYQELPQEFRWYKRSLRAQHRKREGAWLC